MDQWNTRNDYSQTFVAATTNMVPPNSIHSFPPRSSTRLQNSALEPRQRQEVEVKYPIAVAKKVQKADREKLRRDNLNEQFLELGTTLDPDRPKNDKATILTDTIQVLKDLTAEVNRLKAECATLSEETHELMQEKNELREEKASLKADTENLNAQYHQKTRAMFPWAAVDPSVVIPPPCSYPVPVPVPPGPISMHPSLQPFVFFENQNPGAIASPCSTFIPYPTANHPNDQPPAQYASGSQFSSKQDLRTKSTDHQGSRNKERCNDSSDVATDLELKMPGSSAQQDISSGEKKGKQCQRKERIITNVNSSCSSSSGMLL